MLRRLSTVLAMVQESAAPLEFFGGDSTAVRDEVAGNRVVSYLGFSVGEGTNEGLCCAYALERGAHKARLA